MWLAARQTAARRQREESTATQTTLREARRLLQSKAWIDQSANVIDIHHLRTFVAVAEIGRLTQAAERLHLSQPAASAHVKALEESLDLALFERTSGRLVLTQAGHELARLARQVLSAAATLEAKAREMRKSVTGHFRLGIRVDMLLTNLGDVVRALRDAHPGLAVEMIQLTTMNIIDGVRGGDLDAGFVHLSRLPVGIHGIELQRIPYRIVAPSSWRVTMESADASEIARLPWIGSAHGGSHDQMLEAVLGQANTTRPRAIESDCEAVHAMLVKSGVGLALMREDLALAAAKCGDIVIWPGATLSSTMSFVYAERNANDPAVQAVRDLVLKHWSRDGSVQDAPSGAT